VARQSAATGEGARPEDTVAEAPALRYAPAEPKPTSSPNRELPSRGLIVRHGRVTGPVQLPARNAEAFIDAFNERYAAYGIRIINPPSML
jgi:hypothetical protein